MAPKNKFDELKEEWLKRNNYGVKENRNLGETKLMNEIASWVNEMLREMVDEGSKELSKELCEGMNEKEGKGMTPGEIEVCAFIVKNLWDMRKRSMSQCRKGEINSEMKEYVQCAVMNAWIDEYWSAHCERAKNVISNALAVMEELNEGFSTGDGCEECKYKELEPMEILGRVSMLSIIRGAMNGNPKVTQLIRENQTPKEKCTPEEKNDKIWSDFKKTFDDLISRFKEHEPDEIKKLCGEIKADGFGSVDNKKELCKAMLRIRYFINGIKGGKGRGGEPNIEKLTDIQSYQRCIVGMITMLEFFQWHCKFEEIAQYVVGPMEAMLDVYGLNGKFEKCKIVDTKSLVIGQKVVRDEIKKWIKDVKGSIGRVQQIRTVGEDHCKGENHAQKQKEEEEKNRENVIKLFGREKKEELGILTNTSNDFPMEHVEKKLKEIDKVGAGDTKRGQLEKEIEEIIGNTSGCSAHLGSKVLNEEEENWGELFTKFSNHPLDSDTHYDRDKFNAMAVWCEGDDSDAVNLKEHKEFCQLLLKNLLMVKEINYSCEKETLEHGGKKWCVKACDLLNIWLMHIRDVCVSEDVIKGVFTRVHAADELFGGTGEYTECMYGRISNLRRDDDDILNNILKWMECKKGEGELDEIHKKNWCTASSALKRSKGWTQWKNQNTDRNRELQGEEYMKKLNEEATKKEHILQKMQSIVGLQPQPPPPPVQPLTRQGKDCRKINDLCQRAKCVSTQWFKDRMDKTIGNQNWCTFWDTDVPGKLTGLSEKLAKNDPEVDPLCEKIYGKNTTLSETEKNACISIIKGLKHIYNIEVDLSKIDPKKNYAEEKKKKENSRIFHQTIKCIFLNAYADKLKKEVKSPCNITEETITEAFKRGNKKKDDWCEEKKKKNGGDCFECKREANFKDCTLHVDEALLNKPPGIRCEQYNKNIKGKLDDMLKNDTKITTTLTAINNINNTLCNRVNCVTVKWFENRMGPNGRSGTSKQNWCTFWLQHDVGRVFRGLSNAMTNKRGDTDNYCNKVGQEDSAERKVCQYITRGLEYIYKITKNEVPKSITNKENKAKLEKQYADDQPFDQVVGCLFLNVYADRIKHKCLAAEAGIEHAFMKSEQIKNGTSPCSGEGNNCVTCTRKPNFDCTLNVEADLLNKGASGTCENDRINIQNKLGKMLDPRTNGDPSVQPALKALNNICPTKPPEAPQPQAAKPAAETTTSKGTENTTPSKKCENMDQINDAEQLGACLDAMDNQISAIPGSIADNDDTPLSGTWVSPGGKAGTASGPTHTHSRTPSTVTDTQTPASSNSVASSSSGTGSGARGAGVGGAKDTATSKDSSPTTPDVDIKGPKVDVPLTPPGGPNLGLSSGTTQLGTGLQGSVSNGPRSKKLTPKNAAKFLPLKPYFALPGKRKRYRRAPQIRGPSLEQKIVDHVDDQADGQHGYTLVKDRKPRSVPTKRTRSPKKRPDRRGVGRRTIIDIHLEVLDECQRGDTKVDQEDFFEILVQEFMGSNFIKEENVPKEEVASSDSGFRIDVPKEQGRSVDSGLGFREKGFVPKEGVPKEQVPSSDSGFREEDFFPKGRSL
ncbi:SICA antigen [Plasmodium coatneyi]|uniref:SICA antigen n=1 Tax=Plasmodium coatneyi TaxID=208452 RepID=A0A1B1E6S5_9APIC|nr:SICA antigen [Plasmodium coatneyi]ANQ10705.1 SICA antigen [Plasmodium coatneyi]